MVQLSCRRVGASTRSLIKSEEEIALLKKSTEIIEQTVSELYDVIYLGMSRLELTQQARYRLIKNGATGISHITFSFAQANPEVAIDEKLEEGRLSRAWSSTSSSTRWPRRVS